LYIKNIHPQTTYVSAKGIIREGAREVEYVISNRSAHV